MGFIYFYHRFYPFIRYNIHIGYYMCPSQKFVKQFVAYVCIFSKLMNINTAVIGRNSGAKHKYRSNSGKSLLFYLPYWLLFCLQFLSRITSTLGQHCSQNVWAKICLINLYYFATISASKDLLKWPGFSRTIYIE